MMLDRLERYEVYRGPDSQGRYAFLWYWWADYHPMALAGQEHGWGWRVQAFFTKLPPWMTPNVRGKTFHERG